TIRHRSGVDPYTVLCKVLAPARVNRIPAPFGAPLRKETLDDPFARHRYACRRRRPCARRIGPGADRQVRQADDQGAEDDHGAHGQEQPREVLRRRRARQERLRRGRAFLRRTVDARPRSGIVRARAEGRLPEAGGRQDLDVIAAAAGVGLRFAHHRAVLDERPAAAWFEVHAENYMGGGKPLAYLEAIRRDYPIALHGVALSLGAAEGIDERHLRRLGQLADRIDAGLVSEHLAWTASGGVHFPDLLPLPLNEESLAIVCRNIDHSQQFLGRQLLLENPSSYLRFRHSTITEWEFMAA